MPTRKTNKAGKKGAKKAKGSSKRVAADKKGRSASVTKSTKGPKRAAGRKATTVKTKSSKAPAKKRPTKKRSVKRIPSVKTESVHESVVKVSMTIPGTFSATLGIVEGIDSAPSTDEECMEWKNRTVRLRIWTAIAAWADIPVNNLTASTPLGALVPVWDVGEQTRLVANINQQNVFAPFPSRMDAPSTFLPGSVTVGQWENIVWQRQSPRTPCFGV